MTTQTFSARACISRHINIGRLCQPISGSFVFGMGLAQSDTLHNAAHNTRQAIGFPCHESNVRPKGLICEA